MTIFYYIGVEMEEKSNFWNFVIAVAVMAFIGYHFFKSNEERKASLHWPSTDGKIVKSYLKEVQHTSRDDSKSFFFRDSSYTNYEVKINYEYEVDGRSYIGTRIEVDDSDYSRESDASLVLSGYKEGTKVKVYYNPMKPKISVLSPG